MTTLTSSSSQRERFFSGKLPFPKHFSALPAVHARRLEDFKQWGEFLEVMLDAMIAHEGMYEQGYVHGDVCPANIMIFDHPESGACDGILVDLDHAQACKPLRRAALRYPKDAETIKMEKEKADRENTEKDHSK